MVSDEELERHVESFERTGGTADPTGGGVGAEAQAIHDELLRRIEETRANAATRDDLSEVLARLEEIEARLETVERRLD